VAISAVELLKAFLVSTTLTGEAFLDAVLARTPLSSVRQGIEKAHALKHIEDARSAGAILGNGIGIICEDTVPFCLWVASRFSSSFEDAIWATVSALGDRDTTCAIVGGMVILRTGEASIPGAWRARLEGWA
jgi:ADP-ribosylglycohydrolase